MDELIKVWPYQAGPVGQYGVKCSKCGWQASGSYPTSSATTLVIDRPFCGCTIERAASSDGKVVAG